MCAEIRRLFIFYYICGLFIDAEIFISHSDVTLSLWVLLFRSLLAFRDSTYWQLVIDVFTVYSTNWIQKALYLLCSLFWQKANVASKRTV